MIWLLKLNLEKPDKKRIDRFRYTREPYKVAVILPFELDKLKQANKPSSLSGVAVHMYQGIRMARNELDSLLNTHVELYAYDIGRESPVHLQKMIDAGEFDDMDFVIGPLFNNDFKKIADLAEEKKFNAINPTSNDALLLYNEFTYLFHPTPETQATQVAKYLNESFRNKNTIILYDNLSKNQDLASQFAKKAPEQGLKVLANQRISTVNLAKINEIFSQYTSTDIGSIFISSTSSLVAEEIIKVVRSKNINVPIIVPYPWYKFQSIDHYQYEQLQVHFISPDYLDTESYKGTRFY